MMFERFKNQQRHQKLKAAGVTVNTALSSKVEFYGERTGIWPLYTVQAKQAGLIYAFGVGNNLSWEMAMVKQCGGEVFAYDPTPESVAWVGAQNLPEQLHFSPVGLADYCGSLDFFIPRRAGRFNYSVVKRGGKYPSQTIALQVKDLATLCAENNHHTLDVLKLDIEGAEMTALPNILQSGIAIKQILVELHYNYAGLEFAQTVALIQSMQAQGYELFWVSERAYEFGFIHRDATT